MLLFDPLSPTRYDLNFTVANIPVRVHPLFWLVSVLFGLSAGSPLLIVLWVALIFVSILIHELGHALTMRAFGLSSRIVLHGMGGLAIPEQVRWGGSWASVSLGLGQQILISLAGPGAGFALALLVMVGVTLLGGVVSLWPLGGYIPWVASVPVVGDIVNGAIHTLLWVNVFWGLVNLMPVYPLDGGNVARYVWLGADPLDGVRKSLWLSVFAGGLVAVGGLLMGSTYMAVLFGLLAFQSYQMVRGGGGYM